MTSKITDYFQTMKTFKKENLKSIELISKKRVFIDISNKYAKNETVNHDYCNAKADATSNLVDLTVIKKRRVLIDVNIEMMKTTAIKENKENEGNIAKNRQKTRITRIKEVKEKVSRNKKVGKENKNDVCRNIPELKHQHSLNKHFIAQKMTKIYKRSHCNVVTQDSEDENCIDDETATELSRHLIIDLNQLSKFYHSLSRVVVLISKPDSHIINQKAPTVISRIERFSVLDSNIYTKPLRVCDSPLNEYIIHPVTLQYVSKNPRESCPVFPNSKEINEHEEVALLKPLHPSINDFQNNANIHNQSLEKFDSYKIPDFLPNHVEITGKILGACINEMFEFQEIKKLNVELVHHAADNLYMYLSRMVNVNVDELKLITMGSIFTAASSHDDWLGKITDKRFCEELSNFSDVPVTTICGLQMRIITVLDFDVNRPTAYNFRNQYLRLFAEKNVHRENLIIRISGFVLDMNCHNYDTMRLTPSKRAAGATWLARVIATHHYHDNRFDSESLWPEAVTDKSVHSATEVQQLGLHMHTIVLAFLQIAKDENYQRSIIACCQRHSRTELGNLSNLYTTMATEAMESWMTFPNRGADWLNEGVDL